MSTPEPGAILAGKYRVDRVLGEGGMGVVVAATDTQLERKVAIKFLLPEYLQHKEAAQRFLREARAAVKIHSEHVARVIDVGTMDTGAPYMVMEYLEGKDLAGVLEERKTLPAEEAVGHVLQACEAIAEAHSVGIVHRDLKPANLFLAIHPDGSSKIKVLDFGISKATMTSTGMDPSLTRTSSMMGSPLYMSPEQMKSAKNVDPRTDIWALGVILYELLHGEPPFYAESIPELSAKVLLEEPVSIRSRRQDVPAALEAVIMQALAKNPDARYRTIADLALALAPYGPPGSRSNVERATRVLKVTGGGPASTQAMPAAGTTGGGAYARTAAAWSDSSLGQKKRGKGPLIGGAVALAAVLGGAAFFLGSGQKAEEAAPAAAAAPVPVAPEPAPAPQSKGVEVAPAPPEPTPPPSASAAEPPPPPAAGSKPAVARPRPAAAKAKPAAAAPQPAPADPFSGFGSRK